MTILKSAYSQTSELFFKNIGNPFLFLVTDPSKASARGDGLGLIRCGQPTSFTVTAPGASVNDLEINITGTVVCKSLGSPSLFKMTICPSITILFFSFYISFPLFLFFLESTE